MCLTHIYMDPFIRSDYEHTPTHTHTHTHSSSNNKPTMLRTPQLYWFQNLSATTTRSQLSMTDQSTSTFRPTALLIEVKHVQWCQYEWQAHPIPVFNWHIPLFKQARTFRDAVSVIRANKPILVPLSTIPWVWT